MKVCLHMINREHWLNRIEQAWTDKTIVWLAGVRRIGKTVLCQTLDDIEYFDCELPSVRHMMENPEDFLKTVHGKRIVLDEIHRLHNPAELLKIAADHYPDTKIVSTGSSMLGASSKFRDTLAGRKRSVWLTPMTREDLDFFGNTQWKHRFLRGGLPPFFLASHLPERDYQEWMDAFWAKDIQELFRVERRASFLRFTELLLANSGGMFEATRFSASCEVSRPTITNYLHVLESTFVAHVIRPYSRRRSAEIVSAPKVYGFDTGFVCAFKGWRDLRNEDMGLLWEHVVLNEIIAALQSHRLHYWRDKRGHELDFVYAPRGSEPWAIECKWSTATSFSPINMRAFRRAYPEGENVVVAHDIDRPYTRTYDDIAVRFVSLCELVKLLIGTGAREI